MNKHKTVEDPKIGIICGTPTYDNCWKYITSTNHTYLIAEEVIDKKIRYCIYSLKSKVVILNYWWQVIDFFKNK